MTAEPRRLLSRVADAVYWMARYMERAENVARFIAVNHHLQLDLPLEPAQQWQPLIAASGDAPAFQERYGNATQSNVVEFLTMDARNPNSIYSCLAAARQSARSVRETISSEMWEQINSMYLQMSARRNTADSEWLAEIVGDVRLGCHLFQGISDTTMSHNEAWHFIRLGESIERADKISRILDVKYFILLPSPAAVGTPYDDLHWSAILKSVSGFEMYRKKHGRISPRGVVDFLVLDHEFPRSILHCVRSADLSLHAITGTPLGAFHCPSEQLMGRLRSELEFASVERILEEGLHEYLDALQIKMNGINDTLYGDFFLGRQQSQAVVAGRAG